VTKGVLAHPSFLSEFRPVICHSRLLVARKADNALTPIEAQFAEEFIEYQKLHLEKQAALEFKVGQVRDELRRVFALVPQIDETRGNMGGDLRGLIRLLGNELVTTRKDRAELREELEESARAQALLHSEHEKVLDSLKTCLQQIADLEGRLARLQFEVRCYEGELRNRQIDITRLRA